MSLQGCPREVRLLLAGPYYFDVDMVNSLPNVDLVPLLLTGVSLHPPAPKGGPTRTSADVSVPRLAGFSLIT